ncbi:MAG: T9SS type A sorting domain-containing protein [Bacteroidota bacterium]
MKKLLPIFILLLGWNGGLWAQSYLSGYLQDAGNPIGINSLTGDADQSGWTDIIPGGQSANAWSANQTLPFAFEFFGTPVTALKASLNGLVTFDTASVLLPNVNENLPSASLPDLTIAGFWDEFTNNSPTGGNDVVQTQTFGTAPNRQYWVKWFSFEIGNPSLSFAYFAVVLEEGTNKVYIVDQYSTTAGDLTATVGLQFDATTAVQVGNDSVDISGNGSGFADNDYYDFFPTSGAAADVAVLGVSFSDIANQGCATTTEPITIQVLNAGTTPATGILASFSVDGGIPVAPETIPGTFAPGDTATYTFTATADLSAPGVHTVLGIATIIGDGDNSNDSLGGSVFTIPAEVPSLPVVDFTGYNSSNLSTLFPGWFEAEGVDAPGGTTAQWVQDAFGNVAGGPNGIAARINLFTTGDNDWIVGPKVLVGPATQLSFDLAVTDFNNTAPENFGSDDSLKIRISTDCGNTFTDLGFYDVNTPVSNTGQNEVYDLSAFAGQEVIIGFYATEGSVDDAEDYDVFIDNINIEELVPTDVAVNAIVNPSSAQCFLDPVTITVEIENNGTALLDFSADNTDINVDVTGPNAANYSTTLNTGTLASGATMMVDVTTTADLLNGGINTLTAYSVLAADPNAINDTASVDIESIPLVSAPFLEDFETFTSGNGSPGTLANGWTRYSDSQGWYVDQGTTGSSDTGPTEDNTDPGENYLYTEATGGSTGTNYYLETPCLEFSALNNAVLEFYYHMYGLNGNMGTLEVEVIRAGIDTTVIWTLSGQQQLNSGDPFLRAVVDMTPYISDTVKLRFHGIRGAGFESDMAIDDVRVFEQAVDDVAVTDLIAPVTSGRALTSTALTASEPVTIELVNFGLNLATNFDVSYTLNAGTPVTETITDTIQAGDTLVYTFATAADLSAPGQYDVEAILTYGIDNNPANDTSGSSFVHVDNPTVALPYLEGYEGIDDVTIFGGAFGGGIDNRVDFEAATTTGRLRTAAGPGFYRNGDRAATLDRDPSGDVQVNFLLHTVNMSNFTLVDSILFSFSFMHHGEESHPNDRVWVRGADTSDWVLVADLNALQGAAGAYVDVPEMNLSFILDTAGQDYSTSTQIRFGQEDNFPATSITISDGYTFDDVLIRKLNVLDFTAGELLSPMDLSCGDSATMGSVVIENVGQDSALANVQIIVTDPSGVMDTFDISTINLGFSDADTLMFGPINTIDGGDFTFDIVSQLGGDEDLVNDSLSVVVSIGNATPPAAMATEVEVCVGDSAELMAVAEPGIIMGWYDAPVSGNLLATGDTFNTGPISGTTSFYLGVSPETFSLGAPDTTIGPGIPFTALAAQDVQFETFTTVTIDSFTVYPQNTGDLVIRLLDLGGAVINTVTVPITTGANIATRVPVGFVVPAGQYRIDPDGSTVGGLFRNSTGGAYPYEIPNVISITGNTFDPVYYYFFYDWKVTAAGCRSTRVAVDVAVPPDANANFSPMMDELTVTMMDFSTDADSVLYTFGDGNSSSDPSAVYTYGDTGTYEVCQIAYSLCSSDTICTTVEALCDFAEADFTSADTGTVVTFTSTAINADSVLYDFGNGNTSNEANPVFDFDSTGTYSVTMIAYNTCSTDTFTTNVMVITTGLDQFLDVGSLSLFPNPAQDHFMLSMDLRQRSDLNIEVLNMRGQLVQSHDFQGQMGRFEQRLDLNEVAKGMYMVKIRIEGQTIYRKLRIE